MKKKYIKPIIVSNNLEKGIIPLAAIASGAAAIAALAGYAAGRAVVNAIKAQPLERIEAI